MVVFYPTRFLVYQRPGIESRKIYALRAITPAMRIRKIPAKFTQGQKRSGVSPPARMMPMVAIQMTIALFMYPPSVCVVISGSYSDHHPVE